MTIDEMVKKLLPPMPRKLWFLESAWGGGPNPKLTREESQHIAEKLLSMEARIKGLEYDLRNAVESDIRHRAELTSRTDYYEMRHKAAEKLAKAVSLYPYQLSDEMNNALEAYRNAGKGSE